MSKESSVENFQPKVFKELSSLSGLSKELMKNHVTLYEGYVTNVNKLDKLLSAPGDFSLERQALVRRFAFEYNGMQLHERYFDALKAKPTKLDDFPTLKTELKKSFKDVQKAIADFAGMRGIGWMIVWVDSWSQCRLGWVDEHQNGLLVSCRPILVLDLWEHAFALDFGLDKKKYIDAFLANLDWATVYDQYTHALHGY